MCKQVLHLSVTVQLTLSAVLPTAVAVGVWGRTDVMYQPAFAFPEDLGKS
jgi:hypothetical protein